MKSVKTRYDGFWMKLMVSKGTSTMEESKNLGIDDFCIDSSC